MKVGRDLNYKKKFEWKKEQTNQRSKINKKNWKWTIHVTSGRTRQKLHCLRRQKKMKRENDEKWQRERELSIFVLSISPSNITMVFMTTDTWQINRNIDKDYKWH